MKPDSTITPLPAIAAQPAHAAPLNHAAELQDASVKLGATWALQNLSLVIPHGSTLAILGANGAGKSTLLRVLSTLLTPAHGRALIFGADARTAPPQARRAIGYVGHQPMLYRDLTIRENLDLFAKLYAVPNPRARIGELLDRLDLRARVNDPIHTLSRGTIQRVAIARALIHAPALLIADEPYAGLDAASAAAVQMLLSDLCVSGMTLVFATHDARQALDTADTVVVLHAGQLLLNSPAAALTERELAAHLGGLA